MGGDAGAVGDVTEGEGGDITVEGDGADAVFGFHLDLLADDGAGCAVGGEGRGDDDGDVVEQAEFDGAGVHDAGALCGGFEHFFGGDVGEASGVGFDAGVGGVDAFDIGVDLDLLGFERCAECDGGGVGAAATEGGEVGCGAGALEAGDDHDVAFGEFALDALGVDVADAGASVGVVGEDAGLGAGEGDCAVSKLADGHGEQRAADDFAGGEQHIHFAAGRAGADLGGEGDEFVGGFAHGGDDDGDGLALGGAAGDAGGDGLEALDGADAGAAVFLDDGHRTVAPWGSISVMKPRPSMPRASAAAAKARCTASAASASVRAMRVEPPPER